ncbi:MAG: protein adenylyltransferase SelO family protein [Defluviitaleaceae bacterium]|nr:protein adenylyltransferase SelO family protein [Defluviitaleaceae bacterium]
MFNFDNTYIKLPQIFWTKQEPAKNPDVRMVFWNTALAQDLGLSPDLSSEPRIFSGDVLPNGTMPISQAYAGFQYGRFNVLGDGRAVLLGEHITPNNRRFDVQLKGSGQTAFSRGADGLAAIAPMLREVLISEFMAAIGIPATRSLAVVTTGKTVLRERPLQGAVLTRIASSHIRVGTFDFARLIGSIDDIKALADYTIWRHFPHLINADESNKYVLFLREVADKQAKLIAAWMNIGFVHGVMNTDNMAISGETIDFGPCAFMDKYNPNAVFSSIDTHGRYAYKNQPAIGAWNLSRFSEALLPLLHNDKAKAIEIAHNEIDLYEKRFQVYWREGLENIPSVYPRNHNVQAALDNAENGDFTLFNSLLTALQNPYQYSPEFSPPPNENRPYVTFCGT